MAETLKDFLISIGYKVDQIAQKQAEESMKRSEERVTDRAEKEAAKRVKAEAKAAADAERTRQKAEKQQADARAKSLKDAQSYVVKMSAFAVKAVAAVEASALGVVYAVDKAAKSFERLNYMSQRTGASAGKIGAFGYASSQLGSSGAEADGSLEAFGQKLRINGSGYAQALERLGVKARDAKGHLRDTAEIATDLGDALRRIQQNGGKYGYANAVTQASVFGFGEVQARAMMSPDFRKREAEYGNIQKGVGANPDQAAASGTAFEQSMRRLETVLDAVGTKINGVLFVKLKPLLDQLAEWFAKNGDRIANIISRVADDLVKLAAAIGDKIAGADWGKILDGIEDMAKGFDKLIAKLGGDNGLTALMVLFGAALSVKVLGPLVKILGAMRLLAGLAMPPWLQVLFGNSVAADVAVPNKDKPAMQNKWDDEETGGTSVESAEGAWGGIKRGYSWLKRKMGFGGGGDHHRTSLGGGGAVKSGRSNGVGSVSTDGATQHNLTDLISAVAKEQAGGDPKMETYLRTHLEGIRAGESLHKQNWYDKKDDAVESSWGPFQLNRRRGMGVQFERDTGLDVRDPKTIPAQVRWVAKYLRRGGSMQPWTSWPTHGPMEANPRWGDAGYVPTPVKTPPMKRAGPLKGAPALPSGPGNAQGFKGGGYAAMGLGPDGRPIRLGDTPALHHSLSNSTRGDTNVTHNPTFNIHGSGDPVSTLEAARRMASRGHQDLLRNIQGAEQ